MEDVPFEDRQIPRAEIEWDRSLWWWIPLTRAISPAIKMTTLFLGLISILVVKLGLFLGARLFQPTTREGSEWQFAIAFPTQSMGEPSAFSSPIVNWFLAGMRSLYSLSPGFNEIAFSTFAILWLALFGSLLGGVLARRAMVELGQRTIAPWGESIRLVMARWNSFLWATGMHLVGIVGLLIPYALLGLLCRTGVVGATIGGVLLIASFPIVFAVGRMAMSMIWCYPLSVCAIAAEKKADAFEGFSRSNAYLFQRPVVAALCVLILALVGLVGEQLVLWTVYFGWGLIRSVFVMSGGASEAVASHYVAFGNGLATELVLAYWFSFFWAASAAVYLILRKAVDSTELSELDATQGSEETALPPIPPAPTNAQAPQSSDEESAPQAPSAE